MTPAQKQIFIIVDEFWKRYGFGPTVDDVVRLTGARGRGNIARKMHILIELGVCKGVKGRARSIRPAGLKVRDLE